jgi:hypothetical protein
MLSYEKEVDNRLDFFKEKDFDFFCNRNRSQSDRNQSNIQNISR